MSEQIELDFREWKQVPGFEGAYELRNDGLLYSYPRPRTKGGYSYGHKRKDGHCNFVLSGNGLCISKLAHVLVWEIFVGPIPEGYDVHHKNHNPSDNRVENLELLTKEEHTLLHNEDRISKTKKAVIQYTLDGDFVAEYESTSEAGRQTGIAQQNISICCKGKIKTAGGSIWKYAS